MEEVWSFYSSDNSQGLNTKGVESIKLLEKISRKFSFTELESKVILFILSALILGITINFVKQHYSDQGFLEYDYSREDSLFNSAGVYFESEDSSEKIIEKGVDSQRELLDFRGEKLTKKKRNQSNTAASIIDINAAGVDDLVSLPGIGIKTAQNIVSYRNKVGKYIKIDDLLNVKGIGKLKFEKIKDRISVK